MNQTDLHEMFNMFKHCEIQRSSTACLLKSNLAPESSVKISDGCRSCSQPNKYEIIDLSG